MPELWVFCLLAAAAAAAFYGHRDLRARMGRLLLGGQAGPMSGAAADLGEAQLRQEVERAWAEVSSIVDRIIGSGRMLDREVLLDLARFLESAMPAVAAYERLVGRAYEQALADAGVTTLPLPAGEP